MDQTLQARCQQREYHGVVLSEGGFVAMQLDLDIRHRSEGRHCLRDVLRAMWSTTGDGGEPYPEDVQPLFEQAVGLSLEDFFSQPSVTLTVKYHGSSRAYSPQ